MTEYESQRDKGRIKKKTYKLKSVTREKEDGCCKKRVNGKMRNLEFTDPAFNRFMSSLCPWHEQKKA